jgi:tripartite-type tricarboxylate transporter receptor subunit TctC
MPALLVENWTAMTVPATTPDAIVARLGDEVVKIMNTPEIRERARAQGFRVDARGPDAFAAFLAGEVARWAAVIKAANITAE